MTTLLRLFAFVIAFVPVTNAFGQSFCDQVNKVAAAMIASGKYQDAIDVLNSEDDCTSIEKYKMLYLASYEIRDQENAERYLTLLAKKYYHQEPIRETDPAHMINAWQKHREIWTISLYLGVNGTQPIANVTDSLPQKYRALAGFTAGARFRLRVVNSPRVPAVHLETGLGIVNQSYAYQRQLDGNISYSGQFGRWDFQIPLRLQVSYVKTSYLTVGYVSNFLFLSSVESNFPQTTSRIKITSLRTFYTGGLEGGIGISLPVTINTFKGPVKKYVRVELTMSSYQKRMFKEGSKTIYIPGYETVDERNGSLGIVYTGTISFPIVPYCR